MVSGYQGFGVHIGSIFNVQRWHLAIRFTLFHPEDGYTVWEWPINAYQTLRYSLKDHNMKGIHITPFKAILRIIFATLTSLDMLNVKSKRNRNASDAIPKQYNGELMPRP